MSYSIMISISSEDVDLLKNGKYRLFVFQSFEASGEGGIVVCSRLDTSSIFTSTSIKIQTSSYAYNSTSKIVDQQVVTPGNTIDNSIESLITIDLNGNLSSTANGFPNSVAFDNMSNQIYGVGTFSIIQGQQNVSCIFDVLGGGAARVIEPLNKFALIFSTADLEVNTIVTRAMSSGIIVDLEGSSGDSRMITFRTTDGWKSNQESWATQFEAFVNMSGLLIEASTRIRNIEKKIKK